MKVLEALGGRKFVLTVVFAALVVLNAAVKLGLSWQELLVLAGMFGIYDFSNAAVAQANKTITSTYENVDYGVIDPTE